ncbi:hypothetical protein ACTMU2_20750 [Cupriavidus basilensis]
MRDLTRELGGAQLATVGQVQLFPDVHQRNSQSRGVAVDLRNTDGMSSPTPCGALAYAGRGKCRGRARIPPHAGRLRAGGVRRAT